MRRQRDSAARWGTAAVAVVLGCGLAGAPAAHAAPEAAPGSRLELTIRQADADPGPPTPASWTSTATLECRPAGGTHPRPEEACAVLGEAEGDLSRIAPDEGPCTMEHAPVEAVAAGRWESEPVDYREEFPNRCMAVQVTGGLYDF